MKLSGRAFTRMRQRERRGMFKLKYMFSELSKAVLARSKGPTECCGMIVESLVKDFRKKTEQNPKSFQVGVEVTKR
jgi:hypothetical protein